MKSECAAEESVLPEKKLRQKRSSSNIVVGGTSPASTSDPYITRLAAFALSELDTATNSLYTQCIVKIVNASKQVCIWHDFCGISRNVLQHSLINIGCLL